MGADLQSGRLDELQRLGDFRLARGRGQVRAGKLDVSDAHALQMPDDFRQLELAERVTLHANRKSTPRIFRTRKLGRLRVAWCIEPRRASSSGRRQSNKPTTREVGEHRQG